MNTYYKNELYPLQDQILRIIDSLDTPLYLTGGTVLSRCFFHHRYSDDLDLFVNNDVLFTSYAEKILRKLSDKNISITTRSDTFYSFLVEKKLKVDLVNDIASHIGDLKAHSIFSKIDNISNILSNKITALVGRDEPKDVVDIWIVAKNEKINWQQIFMDASSKAVGIFPPMVAERLDTFPLEMINSLNWVDGKKPNHNEIEKDLSKIVSEILKIDS